MREARQYMPHTPLLPMDRMIQINLSMALLMGATFVVFAPAMIIDSRLLDGAPVWLKPQKFHLSLALHFATIAVLAQLLPSKVRNGPVLITFTSLAAAALLLEYVWIAVQAAQAKRSHFNFDSNLEAIMYALMGLGAFLLMALVMALAVQIARKGNRSRIGLWLGAVAGLSLAFVSTLYFGFEMSSSGRYVGAPLEGGGATVPFFGWSREYGDLRPAHFVSLHLMQTLPAVGWLCDRNKLNAKWIVGAVALLQTALAIGLYTQAKAGEPFWPVSAAF